MMTLDALNGKIMNAFLPSLYFGPLQIFLKIYILITSSQEKEIKFKLKTPKGNFTSPQRNKSF